MLVFRPNGSSINSIRSKSVRMVAGSPSYSLAGVGVLGSYKQESTEWYSLHEKMVLCLGTAA